MSIWIVLSVKRTEKDDTDLDLVIRDRDISSKKRGGSYRKFPWNTGGLVATKNNKNIKSIHPNLRPGGWKRGFDI